MGSVWLCVPSARGAQSSTVEEWRKRGYRIALWRDPEPDSPVPNLPVDVYWHEIALLIVGQYQGYATAVNALVEIVLRNDPSCDWIVTGGDDILPDPNHTAEEIARECSEYFFKRGAHNDPRFGVMQPTGDRWGDDPMGRAQWPDAPAYIDRVAGSPWIGRRFCERVYRGKGPIWPEFVHMFEDEHLQCVAKKLNCFWQRRDLTHHHQHWMRDCDGDQVKMPEFLKEVSGNEHWRKSSEIFERLKRGGFAEAFDLLPE